MSDKNADSQLLERVSHDLRQPLQTLSILIGILRKRLDEPEILGMLERQETAVGVISGLLDEIDALREKK